MLAIEIANLTKDYMAGFWKRQPRRALDHLSLQVEAGEIFALLGPNGAGKTTTLKLLMHLVFPTSGTVRLLGCKPGEISLHRRLGYLPENPYFYDHLTAEEFLNYVAGLHGLSAAQRRKTVGSLLEQVGLAGHGNVPLRKFSKGMVQRVGIAQALVNDPELVILDEPMSGLDPLGRREVRNLILHLKQQGKTIFLSTHILPDAETLCDRVAILHRGRLQGCGELREILRMGVSNTEFVLEKPPLEALKILETYGASSIRTGERVRLVVPSESDVGKVLALIARLGLRLVSMNPVQMSLEDYFLEHVQISGSRGAEEDRALRVGPQEGS